MSYTIKNKLQTYHQHSLETMSNIDLLIEAHQKLSQQQQKAVKAFAEKDINTAQQHLENIYALTKSLFTFYGDAVETKNPLVKSLWVTLTGLHQSVLAYAVDPQNVSLGQKLVTAFSNVAKVLRNKQLAEKAQEKASKKEIPLPHGPYATPKSALGGLNIST